MRVHIVPCSDPYARRHHEKTIKKLVSRKEILKFENDSKLISSLTDEAYACWGITNAKNNSNFKNWEKMSSGDICIMYRDKKFFSTGKIIAKFKNKEFSEHLWGSKGDGQLWENMFLIDKIKSIDISINRFIEIMGYKKNYIFQGYNSYDHSISEKIINGFNLQDFQGSFDHSLVEAERTRRLMMWDEVQKIQNERPLTADDVRRLGCYGSARGIWRDIAKTGSITSSGKGVCVGISSRGKYEDEFGEETGTYDYPNTEQISQDQGDIESLRTAMKLDLPLFLIRNSNEKGELVLSGKRRKVDQVFILYDSPEDQSVVLTFSSGGRGDYDLLVEEGGSYEERATSIRTTKSKKRSQDLFRKRVFGRMGPKKCVLCDALPEIIEAAHIRPVADNGSDWGGNGIWLCRNHHSLFDLNKWCIDPAYLEVVPDENCDLSSLQIMRSNIRHIKNTPDQEALKWRWEKFNKL